MRSATIQNHINPRPSYNCTHIAAWVLGRRIEKWCKWNWRYLFKPPILESVAVVPILYNTEDDQFEADMFHVNGLLSTEPLNHYLRLRKRGDPDTFLVNAGFLLNRFALGDRIGYLTLKGVIELAKETLTTTTPDPPPPNSIVSIEGLEIEE